MSSFNAGLSGLNAAQRAMDVIGDNLANANTPGYHRQAVDLTTRPPDQVGNLLIGTGVQVTDVQREQNSLLDQAITTHTFQSADTTAQLNTLQQVQANFGTDGSNLQNSIEGFFNQLNQLASQPQDTALRQTVIGTAQGLTQTFNTIGSSFDNLEGSLNSQLAGIVTQINSEAQQIARLNTAIHQASGQGINDNDQLDQRDQLVNQLAQQVGVQVIPQGDGQVNVIAAGAALVLGGTSTSLQFSVDPTNHAVFTVAGSSVPLSVTGGQAGGLMSVRNSLLPAYKSQLDTIAATLAQQINGIQATGLGLSGPLTSLSGQQAVNNINAPLAQAGLPFPPQAGTLSVSVTNLATGARTLSQISIDPATQSLQDVATALNGISNLQAVADPQTGTLQILAQPGYAFDFAGRPDNPPSASGPGVAQPDTAGLLTALGLNTFFTGSTADNLAVQPALVKDPTLLAASRTGQPGDSSNLTHMLALQSQPVLAGGTQTFTQAANGLVADVGTQIQQLTTQQQTQQALGQQLQAQQQSVSGVDPNEELVQLLSFQRAYQAAAKYIATVNDTLNQLFTIFS